MRQIVLGKTGLKVRRLGFGGIPIQRVDEEQAVETVLHAVERGVDFIDTSRAYTTSERRIGLALKQTKKSVTIASKSQSRTSEGIRADLQTTLTELRKGYIDLYQCHNIKAPEEYEKTISSGGALDGLIKAKEEGLIGHIGVTTHSLDLADRMLDDGFFESLMVCFSFLEFRAIEKIIPKALDKKVGVLAMKPFSGGIIENTALALKYALSHPGIVVLAGVEHKDLFDKNWEIFQGTYKIDSEASEEIDEIRQRYDKNFCRRCDYCQPCTEDIPIQYVLGVRSLTKRRGKDILQKGWIRKAIDQARNCSRCEECMSRCPYELPIPDLLEENVKWVDEQLSGTGDAP